MQKVFPILHSCESFVRSSCCSLLTALLQSDNADPAAGREGDINLTDEKTNTKTMTMMVTMTMTMTMTDKKIKTKKF